MGCGRCGALLDEGDLFCGDCGAPASAGCPTCGEPLTPGKRFCRRCGATLFEAAPTSAPVSPPAPGSAAERRMCSVLFCDIVGFTPLSEARDPEAVRELLPEYFRVARTVIGRYGGVVEKFIGDAVMAVWGTPVATEGDAERAVRAALDLVAAVAELGAESGLPGLAARAGCHRRGSRHRRPPALPAPAGPRRRPDPAGFRHCRPTGLTARRPLPLAIPRPDPLRCAPCTVWIRRRSR